MKKGYKGYVSYEYLEKQKDYKNFELAQEIDRVEPYLIPLTAEEEKRAEEIIHKNLIISLHDHPSITPHDAKELMDYEREGREATAFLGLAHSCLDAVFDNMMDGTCVIGSKAGWKWNDVIHDMGVRSCDIAHQDFLVKAQNVNDIYEAKKNGKIAWFISLESSTMIENELDRIEILYGLGCRMMGITYSESNSLGYGLKEKNDGGLTSFGHRAVERMNKVGMAIDVSHCGDKTAMDVIKISKKPVFITHIGARSLWNIKRLKPDDVLKACADAGGVIGIEAAPHTTITKKNKRHNIESYMEHFEYIKDLTGIDNVAFGPDTLFGDHVGLHNLFSNNMSIEENRIGEEYEHVEYVKGLENPAEASLNIVRWLVKHKYPDEDIKKVLGENIIRVLRENWTT
ncbi:membrane dipeptidase (peptidase family M19) [Oxobacter pfennigii]|uniref:Membrane dipeptidase (Peptidase family M19) n=1 Tax=Oxobacter pfennigii TaxID=36849 RepID=A0A0P9ABA1_9CLOT|nr:membrane dipeptidase [Oxobacter pfennigii]KPU42337.1 membrane dipeptidase (peptidase family M19) [Oxobacter pfennigii]